MKISKPPQPALDVTPATLDVRPVEKAAPRAVAEPSLEEDGLERSSRDGAAQGRPDVARVQGVAPTSVAVSGIVASGQPTARLVAASMGLFVAGKAPAPEE